MTRRFTFSVTRMAMAVLTKKKWCSPVLALKTRITKPTSFDGIREAAFTSIREFFFIIISKRRMGSSLNQDIGWPEFFLIIRRAARSKFISPTAYRQIRGVIIGIAGALISS